MNCEPTLPDPQPPAPSTQPPPANWLDLVLYLIVGFGSFALLSWLIGSQVEELNTAVTFLLFLTNFVCLGGTTVLLGIRRGKISWEWLGIRPLRWSWAWLFGAAGLSILLIPGRGLLGVAVQLLIDGNLDSLQTRSDLILGGAMTFTWTGFLLTLLGAGILVPISEELYFRGLLHSWFWQKTSRFWLRVFLSSAIFGLAHYDSIGVVAASFVIGVVNAILFEKTQSLFAPIIVHMTTNSVATILLFMTLALMDAFPQFFP